MAQDNFPNVIVTPRKVLCKYDAERYALSPNLVEIGDMVIVGDTGKQWLVIDETQLHNDNGYRELASPEASAVTSVNGDTGAVVVDKVAVGLPNVDDTPDTGKPVSTAQAAADAAVAAAAAAALSAHAGNVANPHAVDKTQVGLGNVTNVAQLPASYLETDGALASNSSSRVPSTSAVREYIANNTQAGSSVKKSVTQTAHGFSAKQAVFQTSDGSWALAQADDITTARPAGIIESITNANTFVVVLNGEITGTGFSAEDTYYLSDATPGLITLTQPTSETSYLVQLLVASSTTVGFVEIGEPLPLEKISNDDLASDAQRPAAASQAEAEAGTETALRSWSPLRVAQAIEQLAPSGGGGGFTTGMAMLWPRALSGSIPSGWIEADGNNGTSNETDYGAFLVMQKHGGTVAMPTFSPAAGTYGTTQNVTISCATSGAVIKYTTNGTDPSRSNGSTYSTPVSVSSSLTVKAMAYKDTGGPFIDSAVNSAAYIIDEAPSILSWTIGTDGDTHTLVFSENVEIGAGGSGGFVANMTGGAVTLTYSSGDGTDTLVFTGSRTVIDTETSTGDDGEYTQPGNGIEDSAGNDLASFDNQSITNNSTETGGGGGPTPYLAWAFSGSGGTITASAGPNGTTTGTQSGGELILSGGSAEAASASALALTGTSVITVVLFAKLVDWNDGGTTNYINWYNLGSSGTTWGIYTNTTNLIAELRHSGNSRIKTYSTNSLSDNTYYCFAYVLDNTSGAGTVKLYVDGTEFSGGDSGTTGLNGNFGSHTMQLGILPSGSGGGYQSIEVYAQELTESEIDDIVARGPL